MTEPANKVRCPHCRHALTRTQRVNGGDPDEPPTPGSVAVCPFCATTSIFDNNLQLRKPTKQQLEELESDQQYRAFRSFVERRARAGGTLPPLAEGEEEEDPDFDVIEIPIGPDGELEVEDIPARFRNLLQPFLQDVQTRIAVEHIKKHITAEVANHVLSSYGDEEASMPNVAFGALISLIRLCHESDDYLLSVLDATDDLHGYVLGVKMAETGKSGLEMLRAIGGLLSDEEMNHAVKNTDD